MANGYYLFDCKIVNKSTQSVVAMSAYRSGEKLYSLRDGETKRYKKREVTPESFILKPDNAPDWTLDRETLWNKVEQFEKRDNAQLARSVLLALPNDMNNEQQLELTKEYVQENFVDEGMVADVSIHRDEENNPHAHILLTVREFNENKEWNKRKSKRVPILDENGNQVYDERGWRKTRSVKLNDWDSEKTLIKWRKNWADKLNEKSLKFGLNKKYSDKSYKDQGRLKKPRFRLTRSEYQYEEKMKQESIENNTEYEPTTYYAKKNEEIKKYNEKISNIIHLEDYKTDKDFKGKLNELRNNMHINKENIEATRLLVSRVKGYVDYDVSNRLYIDFHDERNKWKLKLERAESVINSKRNLYAKLINDYKTYPNMVERYGYNSKTFKAEIKSELLDLQKDEKKLTQEREKFIELKNATEISLRHQERLLDAEFNSVYQDIDERSFSYEEKNYAIKLLKENNILLPDKLIKKEYLNQGRDKDYLKLYVPTWKQAKDTMVSIRIYNRTIEKLGKSDLNKMDSDKLKNSIVQLNSYRQLKSSYENYLKDITPIIDQEIYAISSNEHLKNSDIEIKVALLEEYSKLNQDQKENIDMERFLHHVKEKHEEQSILAQQREDEFNENNQEVYKDVSSNSDKVAEGIFSIIQDMSNSNKIDQGRGKRDRTKVFRRRGTDGREL